MTTAAGYALAAGAALVAGIANAVAGGGSLLTFPALVAAGLPKVIASLTNTVAMCPGYLGATLAQRRDLAGQRARVAAVLPAGALGGALGAGLLLATGEGAFDVVVPFLLLFAAVLIAAQEPIKRWLARGARRGAHGWVAVPAVFAAAVYGGYFGAGLGVIVLAALAITTGESLTRANALKQAVSLAVNASAAVVFVVSGRVAWDDAAVMAAAALAGGMIGGRIAARVSPGILRAVVVACAVGFAGYYAAKLIS